MNNKNNLDAMFLGAKAENEDFFKEQLSFLMEEHIMWRKGYHPDEEPFITSERKGIESFKDTQEKISSVMKELSEKMRNSSVPWFSPHYLGHMLADLLLPATLGYMAAILYNPNNCSYEASPASSVFELEVGLELASMMGYDPKKAWGHITSGGTVANFEAIWLARNLKSIPLAVKQVKPDLLKGKDDEWSLLNMSTNDVLDLIDELKELNLLSKVLKHSVRDKGVNCKLGKLLVPKTRHYSWNKALDIFGIGRDQLITVPVQGEYRMDIDELDKIITNLAEQKIPVLGVVSVVGTTEEGAVDSVDHVVELKEKFTEEGLNFYYHIDAAYGGYVRSMFLDESGKFIEYSRLADIFAEQMDIRSSNACPSLSVYNAFKAMPNADSITIDCHKLGYIPYPAGAITLRDKRIIALLEYRASYVDSETDEVTLGPYILEGSKPGASACAVWAAHKTLPLNINGYGKLIARTVEAGKALYTALENIIPFKADNGKKYVAVPLTSPDTNIVVFVFNELGNTSLKAMNKLNRSIYNECSVATGSLLDKPFITSKTILSSEEYDAIPKLFLKKLNIPQKEFDAVEEIYVLRATVMTPFFASRKVFLSYWDQFIEIMKKIVK